jgi:hypothetical protein
VNPPTPAKTPKTTEKPSDTGGGKPADKKATADARKSKAAKAESQIDKDDSNLPEPRPKSRNRRRPTGAA